jgi:hypothetical protein
MFLSSEKLSMKLDDSGAQPLAPGIFHPILRVMQHLADLSLDKHK